SAASAAFVYTVVAMPLVVVVSSSVQPVTPVGAERTRLLAFKVRNINSRSPTAVVAGTVVFGVVTLPWLTVLPTKLTVVGSGAATTVTGCVIESGAPSSSVTVSVTSYVPGFGNECGGFAAVSVPESSKSHA